ncbi:MAG: acetyl-CoA hydrolase/transferase C-terminal domain-containing protein [Candidatus Binatia bacterium]
MRVCTSLEAAALVRSNDTLALPLGPGQAPAFLEALGERDAFDRLEVYTALLLGIFPLFERPGVRLLSGFFGPVERDLAERGCDVHFVPADFRRFAAIGERMRPRVMATAAAPPDEQGRCSLSLHAGATVDELLRCGRDPERTLVVEVNARLPRTLGVPPDSPHWIEEADIDVLVEVDRSPFELPDGEPSDVERAIAGHVRAFVPDGATLQTGIGGIPNAVVGLLAEGQGGDYGVHSEMFTTGLMRLHQAGKITNRKGLHDGYSVTTFALGTAELYGWLDANPEVRFLPVECVNTPDVIASNRRLVSINGALAVDLSGQVVADAMSGRQYSGIGGHEDFVAGASFSEHGRSLVCLPSTATTTAGRVSRIIPAVETGSMVTTPRHQVDTVVTEYGAAELRGLTVAERREALAAIAHPDFREIPGLA